jgi:hypothetical protein
METHSGSGILSNMASQSKQTRSPNWNRDELFLAFAFYLRNPKFPAGALRAACHTIGGVICAGIVMLISFSAQAQNLFVSSSSGNIYQFTPSGAQSPFASGLSLPNEFTPDGARSTFASGVSGPYGLAFEPVPEPSTLGLLAVAMFGLALFRRRQR